MLFPGDYKPVAGADALAQGSVTPGTPATTVRVFERTLCRRTSIIIISTTWTRVSPFVIVLAVHKNIIGLSKTAPRQRANTTLVPDQKLDPGFDVFQQLTSKSQPWTIAELAEVTGFGISTLYKSLRGGKLVGVQLGGAIRVPQRNAKAWYEGLATA